MGDEVDFGTPVDFDSIATLFTAPMGDEQIMSFVRFELRRLRHQVANHIAAHFAGEYYRHEDGIANKIAPKLTLEELISYTERNWDTQKAIALSHAPSEIKLVNFRNKLGALRPGYGTTRIHVRRQDVVDHSYQLLRTLSAEEWRQEIKVTFDGEEGIDEGGPGKEWFDVVARDMLDPKRGLFSEEEDGLFPNENSHVKPNHLRMFEFFGKIVATAVYHKKYLPASFSPVFRKLILGRPVNLEDMKSFDPETYKSMKVVQNYEGDVEDYCIVFADLKPYGGAIAGTFILETNSHSRKPIFLLKPIENLETNQFIGFHNF